MSVGIQTGYYGSGSTDLYTANFIPEVWSGKLQVKFYKSTVLGEITNNDWEGEIKGFGDKIHIRGIPTITVSNYTKGLSLTNQVPTATEIQLLIDQGKYFSVVLDDVDAVQSDVKLMDAFTNDAAQQMKITIDAAVLAGVYANAATANKGATAGAISGGINLGATGAALQLTKDGTTGVAIIDYILRMGQTLDEQNVPEDGRWIVIPAWAAALLKQSDLRQAYLTGDSVSPLRNGKLGQVDRFTVYVSNNLASVTDATNLCFYTLAGTRDAISFASQVTNVETLRSPTTFGNIVRGLNVYGFKVTKPEALAVGYVRK